MKLLSLASQAAKPRPFIHEKSSINLTEPSVRLIARRKGVFG